jgi:hypothetical protein
MQCTFSFSHPKRITKGVRAPSQFLMVFLKLALPLVLSVIDLENVQPVVFESELLDKRFRLFMVVSLQSVVRDGCAI